MYATLAAFALAATTVVNAVPQGVTQSINAPGAPPAGCSLDFSGSFQITPINVTTSSGIGKRSTGLVERQNSGPGTLTLNLAGGKLTTGEGATGYVADNFQFQFDNPPQTGAIYTSGFGACTNQTNFNTLSLGGTTIFWSCISGGFSNLYDRNWAPQCSPVKLQIIGSGSSSGSSSSGSGASSVPDGQPTGQPTASGVTKTSDLQPQAPTSATGITTIRDSQVQAPTSATGVTTIRDSQVQAPTSAAGVTTIRDSQVQAPTSAPAATTIRDSQLQAPTQAPAVSQISDHQPQAPTAASAVSKISDNQPQAPTSASAYSTPTPARYTGAAASNGMSNLALAGVAFAGLAML